MAGWSRVAGCGAWGGVAVVLLVVGLASTSAASVAGREAKTTVTITGKEEADGAWHTPSATLTYTGTGHLHRFTAEGTPTIRFPSAPSVDLGKFTFTAKGRGSSLVGGTDDGSSI